jgi:hypothetical protein
VEQMDPVELPASAYQQLEKTPTGHRDGSSEALDGRGLGTCDSVTKQLSEMFALEC